MKFRTQIPSKISTKISAQSRINHRSRILLFGSCFSENISKKLDYFKFKNTLNPFGILFHPKAIETLITDAINEN